MLTFHPAIPEDCETLFLLNKQLIDTYEDTCAIDYDRVLAWVRRNIQQNLSAFTRLFCDGKLAAYYCLTPVAEKWELDSLFVLPEFQRLGIGSAILAKCQEDADATLFLYVFRKNHGAIRLYQRMGFQITQEIGVTRYIMEYRKQG